MPVDTLATFRATKEVVRTHLIERTGYECQADAIRVLVYQGRWYIEELEPEPGHLVFPRYYLITERDSYVSSDLGDLETKLYVYARASEGPPPTLRCDGDSWLCSCGTATGRGDGFYPCDQEGREMEPTEAWPDLYGCHGCGAIYHQPTGDYRGQRVIEEVSRG